MKKSEISRRQFVTSAAVTAAAVTCLPTRRLFASVKPGLPPGLFPDMALADSNWKDQGVENLAKSPHAKLRNIPVRAVSIESGFWGKRREINVEKSIPSMHDLLESNGRMNNFRRLKGKSTAAQSGPVYSDSDVYKWTEAVGFALQSGDRPELRAITDKLIDTVVETQEPSGYLNTYYVQDKVDLRMTVQTQTTGHELYNIGHMLQGAIAYYRATGDRRLLDAGIRFANDFLYSNYGPAPKKPIVSGHPEIEMGLIELYRITGDKRQLELASYILGGDDRLHLPEHRTIYMYSGTPFTARTKLEGHAVRAMYACCGATDYYMESGDEAYWKTLNTLWNDMVTTKMYVTGGVGSRSDGEAFGDAYELPNFRAYGESCAAIGNMMWNWRMLAATGDAQICRRDRARFIQRHQLRHVARRHDVLLSQSAGFRPFYRRQDPQPLVRHHLLSAQPGAHFRFAAGLFLQHQQRWDLRAPLRQLRTELASGKRLGDQGPAESQLSLGRQCRNHCHPSGSFGVHILRAYSGLGR